MDSQRPFDGLKAIYDAQAQQEKEAKELANSKLDSIALQETIVKVAKSIVEFLQGHTTETVVRNQIKDFATSKDAEKLVSSITSLHETLKTHENTDISPLTDVMTKVLEQVSKIPKNHPKEKEQKFVDYTQAIKSLNTAVKEVERAVKSQKLEVKAPDVYIEPTQVHVDAPNLEPIAQKLEKALKSAIAEIKIPEHIPTDITPLVDEQKKTNKILMDMPLGGGSDGSSSIAPFLINEALPTLPVALALRKFVSGSDIYLAESAPGILQSEALWRIQKIDSDGNIYWKEGTGGFVHTAVDLTDVTTGTFV